MTLSNKEVGSYNKSHKNNIKNYKAIINIRELSPEAKDPGLERLKYILSLFCKDNLKGQEAKLFAGKE